MKNKIKKNRGMSLVEVIVAIGIFSMGMAGFSMLFLNSWESNSYIYEMGEDSFIASKASSSLAEDIRRIEQADNGDYPIKSAAAFDLVVYIDVDKDGKTEKVHYFLNQDSNELRRGISEPSGSAPPTYSSGDDSVATIAYHIINDSDNPVFSYFGNNYFSDSTPFSDPVGLDKINSIRLIKVNLLVDVRPYNAPDHVEIEALAQIRNLKDYEE